MRLDELPEDVLLRLMQHRTVGSRTLRLLDSASPRLRAAADRHWLALCKAAGWAPLPDRPQPWRQVYWMRARHDGAVVVAELGHAAVRVGYAGDPCPMVSVPANGWDGLEQGLTAAGVDPAQSELLLVLSPLAGRGQERALVRLLFERLRVPAAALVSEPVAAAWAYRESDAMVLHLGERLSYACPVARGQPVLSALACALFGGSDVTRLLGDRLAGEQLREEQLRRIKHEHCFVRARAPGLAQSQTEAEMEDWLKCSVKLEPGKTIELTAGHRVDCAEALFGPLELECTTSGPNTAQMLPDSDQPAVVVDGLVGLLQHAAEHLHPAGLSRRQELTRGRVVLSGGTALLPGLATRLRNEFGRRARKNVVGCISMSVAGDSDRSTMGVADGSEQRAWCGAAQLATGRGRYDACKITADAYHQRGFQVLQHGWLFPSASD